MFGAAGFAAGFNDAAARYYGEGNARNQALRPAVMHLVKARLPLLRVSASAASAIAALILVGIFCWLTARPYGERLDRRWLRESSGLLIVAVLLAPIAWVQHLVLAIPAIYLITADWFSNEEFGFLSKAAILLYVLLALMLNREVVGQAWYMVVLDCRVQTLCMLLILGLLMLRDARVSGRR